MIPLTSQQQHCMATPRRGNCVHKLNYRERDPLFPQLWYAYGVACIRQRRDALIDKIIIESLTPADSAEL